MRHLSRNWLVLLRKDMLSIGMYFATFVLLMSLFPMADWLSHRPAKTMLLDLGAQALFFPALCIPVYIQILIWNEKMRGTFLLLRMLPVTDEEIITSKIAVVAAAAVLTFVLFAAIPVVWLSTLGAALTAWQWLIVADYALLLLWATIVGIGVALAYQQQRAFMLPLILVSLPTALLATNQSYVLAAAAHGSWISPLAWAPIALTVAVVFSFRYVVRMFCDRDFAQLVE